MLAWRDWAAYCADSMELKQPIHLQKSIMSEDLEESEIWPQQYPYVPIIIDLEIPVFTALELKDSLNIGGLHQKNLLRKLGIY